MVAARGLFKRIKEAARTLTAKLRPRQPGMIGTPPSARPMRHDPAAHARDFAERYAEPLDQCVAVRMEELGLTNDEIGMPDDDRGLRWAAFHPLGKQGGYNSPDGRLVVESGLLNLDLLKKDYGEEASELFGKSRLCDRLDAIIAHEYEECRRGGSHLEALKHAPATVLAITERAREICEAMQRGWHGR
jgi:hypothetical protein